VLCTERAVTQAWGGSLRLGLLTQAWVALSHCALWVAEARAGALSGLGCSLTLCFVGCRGKGGCSLRLGLLTQAWVALSHCAL